jgi:hypothetical protein
MDTRQNAQRPKADLAGAVPFLRGRQNQAGRVLPIRAAETHFVLKNFPCANAGEPLAFVPLKIIGVSCGMPA